MTSAQLTTAAEHLMAAKMFSLASCVMLFYDIAITFGDEVERIWKQRFTGATVLWFLNRYLSPLGYIVIIVAFHDPSWSKTACQRYVLYPEILKIFTATAVGVIFILRLYSIYSKSRAVLYGFSMLLVTELAVKIWAFTDGVMLQLPPGFVGCILTGRSSPGDRIIYTWVAELVFDSAVFFATLYRTIQLYRRTIIGEALSLITVIMRDGIMYFAAIFVSNLVTVLIFVFAPNDLKVINASFSTLITSLMVSRLMLNLRGEVMKRSAVVSNSLNNREDESIQLSSAGISKRAPSTSRHGTTTGWSAFESSIVGNLGAPIITFERDNGDYYGFDEEEEDIVDPSLPPTPRSEHPPPSSPFCPTSSQPPSPYSPRSPHSYPPTPISPSSSMSPSTPRFVRTPDSTYIVRKIRGSADSDNPTHSSSTHSAASIPVHADYGTHHIHTSRDKTRGVTRQPSTESTSSSFTMVPGRQRPRTASAAFGKNPNQSAYRSKTVRRPRTSEDSASERRDRERERDRHKERDRDRVAEMIQTRSLPSPLIVEVTQEVVVDAEEDVDAASPASSPRSASALQQRTRRPGWLAPPSWRLSRDAQAERDGLERRGGSEG
ncbi:hypothetical protein L226DRAFT_531073 [Lentinus tigrinus ALCF2SS1-7]|uniref:DUF6533 domain-containing protein n=1 Tax=Lentinus tigrinus ALCF2SS1-6 TaxID=1328759 RepID=A0A5C2SNX0_9APHY|nr:hypothetical protein L227DRAFT_570668 [Lentinus tigrinus ALCF2SS1-6]RPD79249.1 hypothetical protein L226DRAFT_531073 [Lentinus tigrinus ALCF2SS1-7]